MSPICVVRAYGGYCPVVLHGSSGLTTETGLPDTWW